ncbi:MAG: sugar ABC transporter substrate-binding protein [Firmicutes bacterium]|nr:sugar ABC transporter substrate-binding protein [Bacillota bacterium]
MRRRILMSPAVIVLALTVVLLGVAGSTAFAQDTELYSMIVFTKGAEYFNWTYAGMIDAAKILGSHIKTELQGPAEWDASLQARTIDQVAVKRPKGILVAAADEATLVPSINRAIDRGIPVIAFDNDAPESKRLSYVGTDNYDFGAVGARAMAELLGGKGEVAIIMVPGAGSMEERAQGFREELERNYPDMKVATIINDEGDVAKAESATTAALLANPNIKGVFSTHGYGGPGAAAAVRTLDRAGKVFVVASDYGGPVLELLKTGEIAATVADNPYLLGFQAMMFAYQAAHPTDVPSQNPPFGHVPPLIYGGSYIITAEDLQDPEVASFYENPPKF